MGQIDVNDMHREQIRKDREKAERKEKFIFTVKRLTSGFAAGLVLTILTSCGTTDVPVSVTQETTVTESVTVTVTESMSETETGKTETGKIEIQSETVPENTPAAEKETEIETAHEASAATWYASTKEHDITINSILTYSDGVIWNFSDRTAVGTGINSDVVVTTEADYGFIVTAIDSNTVTVKPYNNTTEYIVPVKVTAELSTGNLETTESYESYTITGYNACTNVHVP